MRVRLQLSCIFFFKQKSAYEMRISDWSSDVCSSDLSDPRCFIPQADEGARATAPVVAGVCVAHIVLREADVYMLGAYKRVRGRHRPAEARLDSLMRGA